METLDTYDKQDTQYTFSINEAISTGFRLTKKYFRTMIVLGLILMIPDVLETLIEQVIIYTVPEATIQTTGGGIAEYGVEFVGPWPIILGLVSLAVRGFSLYLSIGFLRATMYILQGQKPSYHIMRETPFIYFLRSVGASIIAGIAIMVGFLLLIIPGIYVSARLLLVQYYIAEGYGVMDSIRASRAATRGNIWNIIGVGCMYAIVALLGVLALVVGLLRAIPTIALAQTYVYRALKKNTPDDYHGDGEILPVREIVNV